LTLQGKRVERSRGGVAVSLSGGKRSDEEGGVCDGREAFDSGALNGNDEGRGRGVVASSEESWLVVGDKNGNDEDAEDVEGRETEEDSLYVSAWRRKEQGLDQRRELVAV